MCQMAELFSIYLVVLGEIIDWPVTDYSDFRGNSFEFGIEVYYFICIQGKPDDRGF